jgi:hypothetical protein
LSNAVTESRIYYSIDAELDSGSVYENGDSLGDTASYGPGSNITLDEDETLKTEKK